jgi:hypothetical protein
MTQEQPPDSPGFLYRFFRARRRGRLIILAILIAAALFGTLSPPTTPSTLSSASSTPSPLQLTAFPDAHTTPPTDTVTITLTWDEWQDIGDCINEIRAQITVTLDLAGHTLPPAILTQAHSTYNRLGALTDKLIDDAEAQTHHIPDDQMDIIIDHQLERSETSTELMLRLLDAQIDYLLPPTPQPKKTK